MKNATPNPPVIPTVLACIVVTPGAKTLFRKDEGAFLASLARFSQGDLGESRGETFGQGDPRIHGVYRIKGETLWIVFDGAVTTLLLPDEY